jgi:hypothetical protein
MVGATASARVNHTVVRVSNGLVLIGGDITPSKPTSISNSSNDNKASITAPTTNNTSMTTTSSSSSSKVAAAATTDVWLLELSDAKEKKDAAWLTLPSFTNSGINTITNHTACTTSTNDGAQSMTLFGGLVNGKVDNTLRVFNIGTYLPLSLSLSLSLSQSHLNYS